MRRKCNVLSVAGNLNVSKKAFKNEHVTNTRRVLSVEDTQQKKTSKVSMCL
jgi:hypothetical protein